MKKLFFAALPFLIISCSKKSSNEQNARANKFTIEIVDTLMVDAGEEIILIENMNSRTDVSNDLKYYYNYNYKQNLIDVINLNEMRLEKKIHFETEGPNGTSSNVSSIDYFGSGHFMINNFNRWIQIFDNNAQKIDQFRLDNEALKGDSLGYEESISTYGFINDEGDTFYSFYSEFTGGPKGIAKVDMANRSLTKLPVRGLDAINAFQVNFEENGGKSARSASFNFQLINGKIIMTNSAINEAFVYDTQIDSLYHLNYESKLSPNRQKELSKTVANSYEEFVKIGKEIGSSVNFHKPIYDSENHRYYRLTLGKENVDQENWTYVLTVFDEDLKMISENVLDDFHGFSTTCFVKNEKIYFKHNINDELAFFIMEIKEM